MTVVSNASPLNYLVLIELQQSFLSSSTGSSYPRPFFGNYVLQPRLLKSVNGWTRGQIGLRVVSPPISRANYGSLAPANVRPSFWPSLSTTALFCWTNGRRAASRGDADWP